MVTSEDRNVFSARSLHLIGGRSGLDQQDFGAETSTRIFRGWLKIRKSLGKKRRALELTTFNTPSLLIIVFFTNRMFPKSLKCLLLVLVYQCAASSPPNRDGFFGRTFVLYKPSSTDEPLDLDSILDYDDGKFNVSTRNRTRNIKAPASSTTEEALLFLTGPVSTILIPSFYTLVCCISIPINICAVLAFARAIRPKKPAAIYMLNLAFADLLFAAMLPFKIAYHFEGNNWKFGALMCRIVTAAFYWNMYCSVLLIACISVDRLLAVVYPINSLAWRRPQNAVIACVTMWILSCAGSVPLVISNQAHYIDELNITTCHDVQESSDVMWVKNYFITLCCVVFFLPLVITVASYSRVIWSLRRVSHAVPGSSRRRTRAVVMALTVLVIFVLCFMPTNCLLLAHYFQFNEGTIKSRENPDGSYGLYLVFLCLGSLNCLLDPLVYYFGSSQCQRQLSSMLRCQKITERGSITHTSSDSCRSSTRKMLKSSHTECSHIKTSVTKMDSFQENLNSQYKKLLV
ncbi:proteinase-activated receptor 1-like [Melanotaenia boesemani]|uniref:proteinase-activated receptor 1-like n=1 Tax=Melanotaenia boesemani TaxID=1250792 RepID=UPI001C05D0CD|nr:proteinase-activated receptor 1-like [Melanotaenia boesemani]